MALPLPNHLRRANIQDSSLRYTWDDVKYQTAYYPLDDDFLSRMARISQRANVAFAIACAEWIVHRLGKVSKDPMPAEYLEAAWAAVVDACYTRYHETDEDEWSGPIRKPLAVAVMLVVDSIIRMEDDDLPEVDAVSLSNLAEHLLPDSTLFRDWRERVLARLERLYPRNPLDTRGVPVPREALDPDFDFRPEMAPELLRHFLRSSNHQSNAFLRSPEEMKAIGFEGTPYDLS